MSSQEIVVEYKNFEMQEHMSSEMELGMLPFCSITSELFFLIEE